MTDPIKAEIQELCPDVMELKFGCQLISDDDFKGVWVANDRVMWAGVIPKKEQEIKTILGSPITLAVVLRAINKGKPSALTNVHLEINGNICVRKSGEENFHVEAFWNLEHDNYDQQSEECKQFISNLLGI